MHVRPGSFGTFAGIAADEHARVVDGVMVRAGETVVVADTAPAQLPGEEPGSSPAVRYQVLCRRHHVRGQLGPTAAGPGQQSVRGAIP